MSDTTAPPTLIRSLSLTHAVVVGYGFASGAGKSQIDPGERVFGGRCTP